MVNNNFTLNVIHAIERMIKFADRGWGLSDSEYTGLETKDDNQDYAFALEVLNELKADQYARDNETDEAIAIILKAAALVKSKAVCASCGTAYFADKEDK